MLWPLRFWITAMEVCMKTSRATMNRIWRNLATTSLRWLCHLLEKQHFLMTCHHLRLNHFSHNHSYIWESPAALQGWRLNSSEARRQGPGNTVLRGVRSWHGNVNLSFDWIHFEYFKSVLLLCQSFRLWYFVGIKPLIPRDWIVWKKIRTLTLKSWPASFLLIPMRHPSSSQNVLHCKTRIWLDWRKRSCHSFSA